MLYRHYVWDENAVLSPKNSKADDYWENHFPTTIGAALTKKNRRYINIIIPKIIQIQHNIQNWNLPANTPTDGGTIPFWLFLRQNFLHHHSWLRKHRTLPPRDAPHGSRCNKRANNSGAKPKTPEIRSGFEFPKWAGALGDRSERAKTRARNWRWSQQSRYKSGWMNSVKSTRQRRHCR